ncbi:MAG: hypothetical protein ABUT20_09615 [Bacteroidota bacterium]
MKTANAVNICPYTGLRSFTEDESLYFKGRDLQIDQITALLEQNKFLMVTGASGEGKSSLIYAGLIPNARAGFFKAKYSNWIVADFRPERNPVTNMAVALANQFHSNASTIETELRRGYSSLIDLYTNSEFYTGDENNITQQLTEQEKKERKRKAANLIIIVDQFEEFFTNPENFYNEAASKDSQIVVNLVLETARIAISKNLPVYVVCTMRSDYIGQCSAFRGLPEYIGFSQFFVPRLKRKDLKQVIEEPALLSGIRISQRLIERLVFDMSEGVDQLPILQHALSRIWAVADSGNEELDLIHYAMVGGMPVDELPDEDINRFHEWFKTLPELQQDFYKNTGLSKIIEIHANLLYENAWEDYKQQHPESLITKQDAKRIIALSFSCLTKIDNSRAVRNRMSLEEITGIINSPNLTTDVVGNVLTIFREEGNSFIRPFKTDDPATSKLLPSTVLDITHESLIRNWNKLNQWANREFEFYSTFLDFHKQLDRWKKSGKSRGYLLPAGTLTYFENWYKNCKPNTGWIMRYAETREDKEQAGLHAQQTLTDTREFLKRSARKEMVTRAFMKYGPQRIATVFAILVMLVLSGFYWYNADQKKNIRVVERVKKESLRFQQSNYADITAKAISLLAKERYDSGTLIPYLESLGFTDRVGLANEVYKQLLYFDRSSENPLKRSVFELLGKNLVLAGEPEFLLTETNKFLVQLLMDQYYLPDSKKQDALNMLSGKNYNLVLQFFRNKNLYRPSIPIELNLAIQQWLTIGNHLSQQIQDLVNSLSPLAGSESEKTFNLYYPKGSLEPDGRQLLDFNGGYHTLACIYAANGDMEHVRWCFEKMLETNQRNYFEQPRVMNNHLNVLGYLYQYGHRDKVPDFLTWMSTRTTDNPPVTILRNAVIRSGYISHVYFLNIDRNIYRSIRGYVYPNLSLCDRSVFDNMTEDYEKYILQTANPSERNFNLAMNEKRKAMFYSKYWYDRKMPADEQRLDGWLNQAMSLYANLDQSYLEGKEATTLLYNSDGVRSSEISRNNLLIYPDYRDGWFSWTYHTDYFFNYICKNNLLSSLYKTGADLQNLHYWIAKAYEYKPEIPPNTYGNNYSLPDEDIKKILAFVDGHPEGKEFDRNLPYLVLANHAFDNGDTIHGVEYFHHLDLQSINRSSDKYEYLEKIFFLNMVKQLCVNLAAFRKTNEANELAQRFSTNDVRVFSYMYMAGKLYSQNADPLAFSYLDSTYSVLKKVNLADMATEPSFRYGQVNILSQIGSNSLNKEADEILRDMPEEVKYLILLARINGIAAEGNYYRALTAIPATLTESQDLECRTMILLEACKAKERIAGNKHWAKMDGYLYWVQNYINYIPN